MIEQENKFAYERYEEIEKFLQDTILPQLESGRPDWDRPHTIAVVKELEAILQHNPDIELDKLVLMISAYAHDWGYSDLFENGKPAHYEAVANAKVIHMEIGAKKIAELLNDQTFSQLTNEQKDRIIHLVGIHDNLKELKDIDELILMEADTLGALDPDAVKPTFDKEGATKFIKKVKTERLTRFITEFGKAEAERLIEKYAAHFGGLKA